MQKDNPCQTIPSSRSNSLKGYIYSIEISKKRLHVAAALLVVIISIGIFGFIKVDDSSKVIAHGQTQAVSQQNRVPRKNSAAEVKSFNYERPASADISINKVGGPDDGPYRLTDALKTEETGLEAQLRQIETTSNPQFVPSMWAHLGKVNNEFGYRRNPFGGSSYEFHSGLDIDGERGDQVMAPAKGIVVKADWQGGYGNLIEVDHGNGLFTRYGHLSAIGVQVGDMIERGQVIGLVGSTGRSTGPHLHFEVRLGDKAINPRRFLPPSMPN